MRAKKTRRRPRSLPPLRDGFRLLNLGPKTSTWLAGIGIHSRDQLARTGAIETCRRMRAAGHPVTLNAACAIEAGLMGVHWRMLPFEIKQDLAARFREMLREERAGGTNHSAR